MAETARARSFVWQLLSADATLLPLIGPRIFREVAPGDSAYPFVVIRLLSPGNDLLVVGGRRIWAHPLFLIEAITKGTSSAPLEPIANRIDQLLHLASGTVSNGFVHSIERERPADRVIDESGQRFSALGGEYRVRVSQT